MPTWLPIAISSLALLVSAASASVSFLSYRAAGSRLRIVSHKWGRVGDERWLLVKIANSGRAEIEIEGAWANWLGASVSDLPHRLTGGTSHTLLFRGNLPPMEHSAGPVSIIVGLGNGGTLIKRIRVTDYEVAQLISTHIPPEMGSNPLSSGQAPSSGSPLSGAAFNNSSMPGQLRMHIDEV